MTDTDVLIVGAGPTGLMLALELVAQGTRCRIIDKEPVRSDRSRALVVHARSLELLARHDLADRLVERGRRAVGASIIVNRRHAVDFELGDIGLEDTPYPFVLFVSQAETEGFLEAALAERGVRVERPVVAERLAQDDAGVTTWLSVGGQAAAPLCSRYVVGCDGAHSTVRKAAALGYPGAAYPQDFILADAQIDWSLPKDRLHFFLARSLLVTFPLKGDVIRLIASRPEARGDDTEPTLADFQALLDRLSPVPGRIHDPAWLSRFRLHHRGVDTYRAGRLFVAGDAAHIHSPAGGQGMNTGLQDAVNLGWKLAAVLRADAPEELLDTYQQERHPVGEKLLHRTDRLFRLAAVNHPLWCAVRNTVMPSFVRWNLASRTRRARAFRFVSQLGIRYRKSPCVAQAPGHRGPLRAGDRAPDGPLMRDSAPDHLHALLTGPGHHLLLFSGRGDLGLASEALGEHAAALTERYGAWAQVHVVIDGATPRSHAPTAAHLDPDGMLHGRYGADAPTLVLVRPDAYVGYIGPIAGGRPWEDFVARWQPRR
jgi:2-polyprenyl-6-methoxyphenol hydroxylase-like FAD-dependent oxidoreductase